MFVLKNFLDGDSDESELSAKGCSEVGGDVIDGVEVSGALEVGPWFIGNCTKVYNDLCINKLFVALEFMK